MKKPEIKPGIYQHYKGKEYRVFDIATHSETGESLVVYKTLYGDFDLWVRPYDMFTEAVTVEGQKVPRFKWIRQANDSAPF